ncbi:hypothetical protein E2C01_084152 [Portunus trituberculatus]|uniref:Uncharacterized protein n=1 Tax=Portunus trituberculatus TaxID=210409 RepID=A0A5B7J5J2_PORTR|nr:hypothetical protein [Portunus trituberculatus]
MAPCIAIQAEPPALAALR